MILLEEGRFRLMEAVARYVPAFARVKVLEADASFSDPRRPMTVCDLLTHTSGLSYHFPSDLKVSDMYVDVKMLKASVSLDEAVDDLARNPKWICADWPTVRSSTSRGRLNHSTLEGGTDTLQYDAIGPSRSTPTMSAPYPRLSRQWLTKSTMPMSQAQGMATGDSSSMRKMLSIFTYCASLMGILPVLAQSSTSEPSLPSEAAAGRCRR